MSFQACTGGQARVVALNSVEQDSPADRGSAFNEADAVGCDWLLPIEFCRTSCRSRSRDGTRGMLGAGSGFKDVFNGAVGRLVLPSSCWAVCCRAPGSYWAPPALPIAERFVADGMRLRNSWKAASLSVRLPMPPRAPDNRYTLPMRSSTLNVRSILTYNVA